MHYGVDFRTPVKTPVVASLSGKIFMAGWENAAIPTKGFGYRVWQKCIENGQEVYICYAHLSEIELKEGDVVEAGTRIGLTGNTGKTSGPHLHQEVRVGGISGVKGSPIEYL